jgi:hypothetical protein
MEVASSWNRSFSPVLPPAPDTTTLLEPFALNDNPLAMKAMAKTKKKFAILFHAFDSFSIEGLMTWGGNSPGARSSGKGVIANLRSWQIHLRKSAHGRREKTTLISGDIYYE